jgi:competence protein ComEA
VGKYIPDFNAATKQELQRIPGIGARAAETIIRYRDEVGGIRDFGELMNAEGVTQSHIDRLQCWLQIGANGHRA